MNVRDVMTTPPVTLPPEATLFQAAKLLASSDASDVMVAQDDNTLVGVLSEGDLIRAILPDLNEIHDAGGSVEDAARAFMRKGSELATRSIGPYMITEPLTVSPEDHVAFVSVIMIDRQIRRLPVVKDGTLVGTVSRSDVCRAVLDVTP